MSTIELRNVTKHFGAFTAVKNVSLSVAAGEVVCLLGPSGCGKTTTLRIIAGLERASAGDVVIAGKRMNDLRPDQRDIAMVFQFYALYPALTVRENIMFPLHVERLDAQTASARVARVARMLQLESVLDRLPNHISEGEKQRVAVARAVVRDPNCFLFDEPLSRLDVELRQTMRGADQERPDGALEGDRDRHPRSARGPDDGRPDRDHARRRHRADRLAARGVRQAGDRCSSRASSERRR